MPMFINQSGLAVCIADDFVEKALRDGCRPATEADMEWAALDRSKFALPWVNGFQRGQLGYRPVLVCGGSVDVPSHGVFRIQCNPRPEAHPCNLGVALDGVYYRMEMYRQWRTRNAMTPMYTPHGVHCYEAEALRFGMPVAVIKGQNNDNLEIRTRNGIQKAHFTGIVAVLFARFLTLGPVVLDGFDLRNKCGAGHTYEQRQLASWKAAAELWEKVYIHQSCGGPLADVLPVWEGSHGIA